MHTQLIRMPNGIVSACSLRLLSLANVRIVNIEADTYLFYHALMRLLEGLSSEAQVMLGNGQYDHAAQLWWPQ